MYPRSARYREVITGSHRPTFRATLCTTVQFGPAPTGLDLPILDGKVTLSSRTDVTGRLELTVPGDYWDELQPYGAEVHVARGVDFGDGTSELIPLGYYRIDDPEQEHEPYGPVRIVARDRIAHLIDSRTVYPHPYPASTHRELAERLINADPPLATDGKRKGYGMYIGVTVPITWSEDSYDPDTATVAAGVCEDDVHAHLAAIFDRRGCVLRADRHGGLVVQPRDRPPGTPSVLTIGPGAVGTLVRSSRRSTRRGVHNMVVARSSDPEVPTVVGLDYIDDPTSPLRWFGPFGVNPRFYASPLIDDQPEAQAAAETIQARYRGLPTGTAVAMVPDPALDPLDPVTIAPGGVVREHLVDEVEIPLTIEGGEVQVTTRTLNEVPEESDGETPDPGGDPDPGETPSWPWELLKIGSGTGWNSFKLGVGFSPGDDPQGSTAAVHRDFTRAQIQADLSIPDYFELINGRVRMSTPLDGGRTSAGTQYPRVEFREMALDGVTLASFDSSQAGTRYIEGRSRVTQLPPSKPHVVLAQIHDGDDDIATWRVEGTSVRARYGDSENVGTTTLALGTDYEWMIEVVTATDGAATCQIRYYWGTTLPGSPNYTKTAPTGAGWYFKAGCYAQTNTSYDALASGPVVVEMSALECWRTGYPDPVGADPGPDPDPDPDPDPEPGSPVPSGATLIFASDFDDGLNGSPVRWSTVQNKNHNGSSSSASLSAYPITIVNDGAGHETALRFEVRSGDEPSFGGERSEVRFPGVCDVGNGDERWYEFDLRFASGFQGADDWLYPMQWHAGSGSPPLAINVNSDETLSLRVDGVRSTIGAIDSAWHRYTLRVKFSGSAGTALHEVWRDGVKLLTVTGRKNMSSSSNYMKLGVYRRDSAFTSVLLFDRVRVWSV